MELINNIANAHGCFNMYGKLYQPFNQVKCWSINRYVDICEFMQFVICYVWSYETTLFSASNRMKNRINLSTKCNIGRSTDMFIFVNLWNLFGFIIQQLSRKYDFSWWSCYGIL